MFSFLDLANKFVEINHIFLIIKMCFLGSFFILMLITLFCYIVNVLPIGKKVWKEVENYEEKLNKEA